MKKENERRTVLTVGEKITRVNIIDDGNAVEIFSISDCEESKREKTQYNVVVSNDYIETYFPIVKASTLSLDDKILKYEPTNVKEKYFKNLLTLAIKSGLTDFRAQRIDPSFDDNGNIIYEKGRKPAVYKSPKWWEENAVKFIPEKRSRQGNITERVAFLGLLIKYLVDEENYTLNDAWKAICYQSKNLGHYRDSVEAKFELEPTGSRKIGEWYDLANTFKIIINENESSGFSEVSGSYYNYGGGYTLADVSSVRDPYCEHFCGVGWIVLDV